MWLQLTDCYPVAGLADGSERAKYCRRECHGKWKNAGIFAARNDPHQRTGKNTTTVVRIQRVNAYAYSCIQSSGRQHNTIKKQSPVGALEEESNKGNITDNYNVLNGMVLWMEFRRGHKKKRILSFMVENWIGLGYFHYHHWEEIFLQQESRQLVKGCA
mmetsp:Transcript_5234/g.10912  ORF Transcript_5234/g.10912 Transcript_5234/m.10912 type:complete len:159 (-) Transcript_5234:1843-2319(-)